MRASGGFSQQLEESTHPLVGNHVRTISALNEQNSLCRNPRDILRLRTAWIRASGNELQMEIKKNTITTRDTRQRFTPRTLLDCGCNKTSIDLQYVRQQKLTTKPLPEPTIVRNADFSINGYVKEYVELEMEFTDHEGSLHREVIELQVVNLGGKHDIFIGYDWFKFHNPLIDWRDKWITMGRCPDQCNITKGTPMERLDQYVRRLQTYEDEGYSEEWIRATGTKSTEIAADQPAKTVEIPPQYQDFKDVFEKTEFDKLPERRPWDHAINLKPGMEYDKRLKGKVYPVSPSEQEKLDEFIAENLKSGRIRPSQSPIAAPFFFVKKKDGALRPVQDYRRINEATIRDSWPLPLISDVLNRIKDAKYFSKFDVRWGFNNVRIKEGDEHKAAFITNRGLFEPLVMFFGLTNSPATFQHMMDDIFGDLVRKGVVIVYMDDILVYTKTLEEHRQIVREVLKRLRQHRLYLKLDKCAFEKEEIDFLGIVVRNGNVAMDPVKTKAVEQWPRPSNVKEIRSFMQFCNFYRTFIPEFADITVPFNELTKKDVVFKWTDRQEHAFQRLKDAISREVTLMLPVPGARFRLETDASNYAAGAVLHQIIEGKTRPLAFFSKTFDPAQRNYEIYDKEMLAIMLALDHWRHFLRNAPQFDIWTDHENLKYFKDPQKLNRRQARWYTELSDYDFILHHRPGKLNIVADTLSRKDKPEEGVEDNANVTLLPFSRFSSARKLSFRDEDEIMEEIRRRTQQRDDKVIVGLKTNRTDFKETNNIVTYKDLVYVPRDKHLRERIVYAHHDTPIAGHPGRFKTAELIQRNYWWPGVLTDVSKYVRACEKCQRAKPRQGPIATNLHPFQPPENPWESISADLIGPLPQSNGFNAIFVVKDRGTKGVVIIPCSTELSSEGTARLFRDYVFKRFGLPKKVTSDRGPQFVSAFMTEFYRMIGVEANPSTAWHPQTDGHTERENAEIEKYLRMWVNERQDDWAEWIAIAEFAINNRIASATGHSPFYLNHGRHPRMGVNPRRSVNPAAEEFAKAMSNAWEEAQSSLKAAASIMKQQADTKRKDAREYQEGDQVWLEATNINVALPPGATKKLTDKRIGPFKVIKKIGASAYRIQLPELWSAVHPVFNESLLSPYYPPEAAHQRQAPKPAPELINGKEEYEVEEILNSRKRGKGIQYLIKWKGYGREANLWISSKEASNAPEKIKDFHQRHPDKPRPAPPKKSALPKKHVRFISDHTPNPKKYPYPENATIQIPDPNPNEPLTTGIDHSLPSEAFLREWAYKQKLLEKRKIQLQTPSPTRKLYQP